MIHIHAEPSASTVFLTAHTKGAQFPEPRVLILSASVTNCICCATLRMADVVRGQSLRATIPFPASLSAACSALVSLSRCAGRAVLKMVCLLNSVATLVSSSQSLTALSYSTTTAAQIAADARMRARNASNAVATRVELVRERAGEMRKSAKEGASRVRATAVEVRKRAEDVRTKAHDQAAMIRERAADVKGRAVAAKDSAVAAKDRVVEISRRVQDRIGSRADIGEGGRKLSTGAHGPTKASGSRKRLFHTTGLHQLNTALGERFEMVRTRFS